LANSRYDLAVIGSGPGGYVAAIRASQLKMRVAVVEREEVGGVCLNWGCIPSKALLNSAETLESIHGAAKEHGIEVGEVKVDFTRVIKRSREAADKLSKGVRFLLRKNKVDLFEAAATVAGPNTVALTAAPGKAAPSAATIEAERILVATGSGERLFGGMKVGDGVMTSREALLNDHLPESVVVIGAGAVGLEFAYFYQAFGVKVTVVELEKQMLPAPLLRQARSRGAAGARVQIDGAQGQPLDGHAGRRRRSENRRRRSRADRGRTASAKPEPGSGKDWG
jgi:dihydrolipoamide dehydrogenase